MAALVSLMDDLVSDKKQRLRLRTSSPSYEAVREQLRVYLKAFDKGLVPCQQLMEILVPPFVKLGRKAIALQGSNEEGILDAYTTIWCREITTALAGDIVRDSQGVGSFLIVVRPEKRLELVRAILNAELLEVGIIL